MREKREQIQRFTKKEAAHTLPKRPWDGHKGTFGKVCIIGGSVGLTGAPVLAALGAARTGSGLVYVGVPREIYPITAAMCLEAMPFPLPDREGMISPEAFFKILERINACGGGLIGPGLGRSPELALLIRRLLEQVKIPLVLDADALYAIRNHKEVLKTRQEKGRGTILTPHEGEFAYLGGKTDKTAKEENNNSEESLRNRRTEERVRAAKTFANEYRCILVLKGPDTITASSDGTVFVNTTGNNGMAKGGSGDLLSGMILSLLGQGVEPVEAAALAVWLHGYAGDLCREKLGEYGMLPRDMADQIPQAILSIL